MNHNDDIDRIEADIAQTRAEMDRTLSELQGRFTPGQLLDQGLARLKASGGNEFISNFGATVKYNPMPVALAGIGIAWLMASGHRSPPPAGMERSSDLGDSARGMLHRAGDTAGSWKARLGGAARSSRDSLSQAGSAASERLGSAAASARERASQISADLRTRAASARRGFQGMLEEQPLLVGAIGLAMGAALAAALPRTRAEDELMGEASDRLSDKALQAGEAQVEKAGQAAKDLMASAESPDSGSHSSRQAGAGNAGSGASSPPLAATPGDQGAGVLQSGSSLHRTSSPSHQQLGGQRSFE